MFRILGSNRQMWTASIFVRNVTLLTSLRNVDIRVYEEELLVLDDNQADKHMVLSKCVSNQQIWAAKKPKLTNHAISDADDVPIFEPDDKHLLKIPHICCNARITNKSAPTNSTRWNLITIWLTLAPTFFVDIGCKNQPTPAKSLLLKAILDPLWLYNRSNKLKKKTAPQILNIRISRKTKIFQRSWSVRDLHFLPPFKSPTFCHHLH